ncbi:MAG: mechanosensitive ion channel family protein [Bacteroidetes bacterium]|nr:MAG: mechanosensitive ion channel family protein [Bacteroidota bacterium]
MDVQTLIREATGWAVAFVPRLFVSLLTLFVGLWMVNRGIRLMRLALNRREMDGTLRTFLSDLVNVVCKTLVLITAAGMIGIETTSFVTLLGAASLAVGLALQGSLSNFAGGVMILLFKPFRVGDLVDAQGFHGHVRAINIFVTTLETPESKTVSIPNGPLSNGNITNYSTLGRLRVDIVVSVGYESNIPEVRKLILAAIQTVPGVLAEPAPAVSVLKLGHTGVDLAVRPYAATESYWDVCFGVQEAVNEALLLAGVKTPVPQQISWNVEGKP